MTYKDLVLSVVPTAIARNANDYCNYSNWIICDSNNHNDGWLSRYGHKTEASAWKEAWFYIEIETLNKFES